MHIGMTDIIDGWHVSQPGLWSESIGLHQSNSIYTDDFRRLGRVCSFIFINAGSIMGVHNRRVLARLNQIQSVTMIDLMLTPG